MDRRFNLNLLGKLTLLFLLIVLIGLAPRAYQVTQNLQLAQRAAENDSPALAADHLAEAAKRQPWRFDLWELAGHYALMAGEPTRAIGFLNKVETDSPGELTLHGQLDLGEAYYQINEPETAQSVWVKAIQTFGPSQEVSTRLAQLYREAGDYEAAIEVLEQLSETLPKDAELHFQLALLYAADGSVEAAQKALDRAAELDPELGEAAKDLQGNLALARRQEDPAYAPLLICQGLAALEKWSLAAKACKESIQQFPEYAEAWAYLGLAYYQLAAQRDISVGSDGLAELETALELDPNSLAANSLLAIYWMGNESYDLALEYIEKAIELAPERADLRIDQGTLLALSGDLPAAFEAYMIAIEQAPYRTDYIRHLIDFSLKYDYQVEQIALPAARRAVNMAPDDPANLDQMAQVMIQLGDLSSAERFALRALEIEPDYSPAYLHLGMIYLLRSDRAAALEALNTAVSLDADSPIASQANRLIETYFP